MTSQEPLTKKLHNANVMVWVLAPYVKTTDANINYYYDYRQSILEFTNVFASLGLLWKWQPVTIHTYKRIIKQIEVRSYPHTPLVFNLCDGDEINLAPGIAVIRELEKNGLLYTGADEFFYDITTSKMPMKKLFDLNRVTTPRWKIVPGNAMELEGILTGMKLPVIVKPAVSGGSMGLGVKSVVYNEDALKEQLKVLNKGYRGWDLVSGGVIIEEFIEGPEFTVLIVGSSDNAGECTVYPPAERVFHPSLPEVEKFLSFERLWEFYEEEKAVHGNGDFYNYHQPAQELINKITDISVCAYAALKGQGYGRVDIRMDKRTGTMYVLEVNAQCGLSDDENFTSIGAILRLSGKTFTCLVEDILLRVVERSALKVAV